MSQQQVFNAVGVKKSASTLERQRRATICGATSKVVVMLSVKAALKIKLLPHLRPQSSI